MLDTVYASMRETGGRNATAVKAVEEYAAERKVDVRAIELDVVSQDPKPRISTLSLCCKARTIRLKIASTIAAASLWVVSNARETPSIRRALVQRQALLSYRIEVSTGAGSIPST
jgi:hypothetical protein